MARAKPAFIPFPRVYDIHQVATRLGMCENSFRNIRTKLEAKGFPREIEILGGWDADAIDLWIDSLSGINRHSTNSNIDHGLMEAIYD